MEIESSMDFVKEVESIVSELESNSKTYEGFDTSVEATEITDRLQELSKTKQDLREKFNGPMSTNNFMKNLAEPREEWAALISKSEEELQTAKATLKTAKQEVKDQKSKMKELNAVFEQGLTVYQQSSNTLKERLQVLENMNLELQTLQESLVDSKEVDDQELSRNIETELENCVAEIKECHKQLLQINHNKENAQNSISQMEEDVQQMSIMLDEDEERMDQQCLSRLQMNISDMESLGGVTCKIVDACTVIVEFPPKSAPLQSAVDGVVPSDDLILKVTLTLRESKLGGLKVLSVKSNLDSFDIDGVWKDFKEGSTDSLPILIGSIKQCWFSHMPLLSEVNALRSRFAIDWIQQENTLRVIVGKGGGIVCSLEIPAGYPHRGQVALTSVLGAADNVQLEDLKPQTGGRLEHWVQLLENTFGKA